MPGQFGENALHRFLRYMAAARDVSHGTSAIYQEQDIKEGPVAFEVLCHIDVQTVTGAEDLAFEQIPGHPSGIDAMGSWGGGVAGAFSSRSIMERTKPTVSSSAATKRWPNYRHWSGTGHTDAEDHPNADARQGQHWHTYAWRVELALIVANHRAEETRPSRWIAGPHSFGEAAVHESVAVERQLQGWWVGRLSISRNRPPFICGIRCSFWLSHATDPIVSGRIRSR